MALREAFTQGPDGRRAYQPAGSILDWAADESKEMAATSDTINEASVVWALDAGLTPGAIANTPTNSAIFITAPPTSRELPYRCTLTYTTTGGRKRVKAFWLYVADPILFA